MKLSQMEKKKIRHLKVERQRCFIIAMSFLFCSVYVPMPYDVNYYFRALLRQIFIRITAVRCRQTHVAKPIIHTNSFIIYNMHPGAKGVRWGRSFKYFYFLLPNCAYVGLLSNKDGRVYTFFWAGSASTP